MEKMSFFGDEKIFFLLSGSGKNIHFFHFENHCKFRWIKLLK